jgi:predicted LPLAT superfamily acyltransferase
MTLKSSPPRTTWKHVAEVGSTWGMRLLIWISRILGRPTARALLYPIALYYMIVHRKARTASIAYLRRMSLPTTFSSIYYHFLTFAQCTLDKLYFLSSQYNHFYIVRSGEEHLIKLKREKKGALLLCAHVGASEAMRSSGIQEGLRLNIVTFSGNAQMINHVIHSINPSARTRMVELSEDGLGAVFQIKELIEQGELVAIMGDRAGFGPVTRVRFLNSTIEIPTGPYMLASAIGCPVYLTFGLYFPPNRYQLYCEPFSERIVVPRKFRKEALENWGQQFATRLEHYCKSAPYNWFNFYDVWINV